MTIEEIEKEWQEFSNGIRLRPFNFSLLDTVFRLIDVAKVAKKHMTMCPGEQHSAAELEDALRELEK